MKEERLLAQLHEVGYILMTQSPIHITKKTPLGVTLLKHTRNRAHPS